jgi:hypothetical protein
MREDPTLNMGSTPIIEKQNTNMHTLQTQQTENEIECTQPGSLLGYIYELTPEQLSMFLEISRKTSREEANKLLGKLFEVNAEYRNHFLELTASLLVA